MLQWRAGHARTAGGTDTIVGVAACAGVTSPGTSTGPGGATIGMDWTREVVAVTGAAGFIGSHVAGLLTARGARVVGIDSFDPFYERSVKLSNVKEVARSAPDGAFTLFEADCTDRDRLAALFAEHGVTGIVHLAARAGVRPSVEAPVAYAMSNVVGTTAVLDAATAAGARRALVASSSSVYGNNAKTPFAETDPVETPISPYAWTKRATELACGTHHHLHGLPIACLRFFTVFGPRQRPDLAISLFLGRLARGEALTLYGSGQSSRDYTYIDDIAAGVLSAYERIEAHGHRIWNLGSDRPVTLDELVGVVGRATGVAPRVVRLPARAGDVERTWADLTRSRAELGYAPRTSIEEGVGQQWAWMRAREGASR